MDDPLPSKPPLKVNAPSLTSMARKTRTVTLILLDLNQQTRISKISINLFGFRLFIDYICTNIYNLDSQSKIKVKFKRAAIMKILKDKIEVKMEIPGAILRQKNDFGDATGLGKISGEYFSLSAGVDTTPLFIGLEGNLCQCPHWGYLISGQITTTNAEGIEEVVNANELFFWPSGHNVLVNKDAEIIMFSPQKEHTHVINHMIEMVKE